MARHKKIGTVNSKSATFEIQRAEKRVEQEKTVLHGYNNEFGWIRFDDPKFKTHKIERLSKR